MEKTINISGKDVPLIATASTVRRYRAKFQRDILTDFELLMKSAKNNQLTAYDYETFENMTYIMAKQADETIPEDIYEWLDGFELLSIYDVLPEVIKLWNSSRVTLSESKKNNVVQKGD